MDSRIIKKSNRKFVNHFPVTLPSMGWYFSSVLPEDSIELQANKWTCMFKYIENVTKGNKICFSQNSAGCSGAACYFGFTQPDKKAGGFLASEEKFNLILFPKAKILPMNHYQCNVYQQGMV